MKPEAQRKLIREYLREQGTLTPALDRLIFQHQWSLLHGPGCDNDPGDDGAEYPGWEVACDLLDAFKQELPGTLYVDTDAEYVTTSLPDGEYECDTCYWSPAGANEDFYHVAEGDDCEDDDCDGHMEYREPDLSAYREYDRADIFRTIVGKDIAANM